MFIGYQFYLLTLKKTCKSKAASRLKSFQTFCCKQDGDPSTDRKYYSLLTQYIVFISLQACSTPPKSKNGPTSSTNGGVVGQIVNGAGPNMKAIQPNVMSNIQPNTPISGQLLTLPTSVLSKVNSQQPLSLKVNNQKLVIPPNCFISTPDGVKVFLPSGTLPSSVVNSENKAANMKLNVNKEQNQQDLSLLPDDEASAQSPGVGVVPDTLAPTDNTCYFEKLQVGVDVILNIFRFLPHCDLLR